MRWASAGVKSTLECDVRFVEAAHLQQMPAPPALEHVHSPVLSVTLGRGEALVGDCGCFVHAIERVEDPRAIVVREAFPRVVYADDSSPLDVVEKDE